MNYKDLILHVRNHCRSFLQGISRRERQFILPVILGGIGLVISWLLLPGEQPVPLQPAREKAVDQESFIPVDKGKRISRAEVRNPFSVSKAKQKNKTVAAEGTNKSKKSGGSLKVTGIIKGKNGAQAIILREKESIILAEGESRGGISLIDIDEIAGYVIVADIRGEQRLWLGR